MAKLAPRALTILVALRMMRERGIARVIQTSSILMAPWTRFGRTAPNAPMEATAQPALAQMLAASAMPEGCSIDVSACGTP